MPSTALLIGLPDTLARLERQLDLLPGRPATLGWVLSGEDGADPTPGDGPVLGPLDDLETIVARQEPDIALVSLPAVMHDRITSIRTRLRRLGVPDRFVPTLEDLVAGVGPRTVLEVDHAALIDRAPYDIGEDAVRRVVTGRRILITGAGGSIGGELSRIAARFGPAHLALMDRSENAIFEIDRQIARSHPAVERSALLHDVVDVAGTRAHCERLAPHVIIHAAAHKHVPMMEDHPGAAVDNNLFGTRSIVDAADATGVERLVMISTDKAVNPSSIMGATKRLAEQYVQHVNRRSSMHCSIVRFGNVLGSAGSVLGIWSREIADGGPITVTDPAMTRYFMTIPEAAALVLESAALVDEDPERGEVFLLDMGDPVRILDMARRFVRAHGLEPRLPDAGGAPRTGEIAIAFTGARPGEKLHEQLVLDSDAIAPTRHRKIAVWRIAPPDTAQIDAILRTLGPGGRDDDPRSIAEAVRRLVPEMAVPVTA